MAISPEQFREMERRTIAGIRKRKPLPVATAPVVLDDEPKQTKHESNLDTKLISAVFVSVSIPAPRFEYTFAHHGNWRFDIAWPDKRVAIEVQGGLFKGKPCPTCGMRPGGSHSRGAALVNEFRKTNAACALGWRVMETTPEDLLTTGFMAIVKTALEFKFDERTSA